MRSSVRLSLYRALAFVAHRAPLLTAALANSVAGRGAAVDRWMKWARSRPPGPLIWIHGASVGELLGATSLVPRLQRAIPDAVIMYTHSSPSAARWTIPHGSRLDYVPLDEPVPVRRLLQALEPRLLLYSCGDVWPELTVQAIRAGIPVAVAGARARPSSLRASAAGRLFYRWLYRELAWVGARSSEDAERWIQAGAPADRVTTMGDPRHDQAVERVPALRAIAPILDWARGRSVLVAGSTDERDEEVLLAAAPQLLRAPDSRVLIVPHQPESPRVSRLPDRCRKAGLACSSWTLGEPAPDTVVVVVPQTGVLFDLYAAATVAYVGGGFGRGQVHAVVEPAAWAVPVIVGPAATADRDVQLLGHTGGVAPLPRSAPATAMSRQWEQWKDPHAARNAGLRARAMIDTGAATRAARAITALLSS